MSHEWNDQEVKTLGAMQIEVQNTMEGVNQVEGYGYLKENESEIFEYVSKCIELAWIKRDGDQKNVCLSKVTEEDEG